MKPVVNARLISFLCALVLFTALPGGITLAHVDSDSMPDSVAEVEYRIFLEFKPKDIEVLNKLGMVYYRLNKLPEAVREFSKVLKKDSDNYDALDGMGLVKAAQQNYDGAISYHQRAIAINADDMVGYYHLGSALEKKGLLNEAAKAYHLALAKFDKQYPPGTENKQAAEFKEKIKTAISQIETKL
jgi:tetratricopeptide (TPR) repeat protein